MERWFEAPSTQQRESEFVHIDRDVTGPAIQGNSEFLRALMLLAETSLSAELELILRRFEVLMMN
jgi:hypothetical protein